MIEILIEFGNKFLISYLNLKLNKKHLKYIKKYNFYFLTFFEYY